LWGLDRARLVQTQRPCQDVGPAPWSVVEVCDREQVESALREVDAHGPFGAVVSAAGLFDWAPADEADPAAWQRLLGVSLTAAAVLTRLALPALLRAAPSALFFIGSAAGHRAFATNAAYVASKHGLAGLARATFLDVRDRDVKVGLVSPGLVAAGNGLLSEAGRRVPRRC
jgi:NAD(P)-dependent dehydrogenase (short-subunit alcohol dehydrogenase family)